MGHPSVAVLRHLQQRCAICPRRVRCQAVALRSRWARALALLPQTSIEHH
jgi:hypothetical protein